MKKFNILILSFIFLNCDSKNNRRESGILRNSFKKEFDINEKIESENFPLIIYDTLVFTEFMKGSLLDKKIKDSQEKLHFYKAFIKSNDINTLKVLSEKGSKTEIKYLGELKDITNKNSYSVITNFKIVGIGEMLSPRGQTEIAFIDRENNIMTYNMGMPENLPNYIESNTLFFKIEETMIGLYISGGLGQMFCVPTIGCND